MSKLTRPFCLGYVHIHDSVEAAKFRVLMEEAGIVNYSDFGEIGEHKWTCSACDNEVREHDDEGNCLYPREEGTT